MSDHDGLERLITIGWNQRSRSPGTRRPGSVSPSGPTSGKSSTIAFADGAQLKFVGNCLKIQRDGAVTIAELTYLMALGEVRLEFFDGTKANRRTDLVFIKKALS
jgi:hypothetical protein